MPVMDKNIKSWSHQPKLQKSLYFLIFHKARLAFQEFCLYLQTNQQRGTAYGKIHQPFYICRLQENLRARDIKATDIRLSEQFAYWREA